jgi:hypothetical protein
VETAGVEPAPSRCKRVALPAELRPRGACCVVAGRVLARRVLNLCERHPDCRRAAIALAHASSCLAERCGRVESNHHSRRQQGYSLLSSPMLGVRVEGATDRIRTGTARFTTSDAAVTPQPPCKTAGTTGLEPATYRLTSECSTPLSYAPKNNGAGGIRTHGLELMRLARTAAPLPR